MPDDVHTFEIGFFIHESIPNCQEDTFLLGPRCMSMYVKSHDGNKEMTFITANRIISNGHSDFRILNLKKGFKNKVFEFQDIRNLLTSCLTSSPAQATLNHPDH